MSIKLLTGKDVQSLDNFQLPAVMNALLKAEAGTLKVPILDLETSTHITEPDDGVDATINLLASSQHDILGPGRNVLQYKAGKLSPALLQKEASKPGVVAALRSGETYTGSWWKQQTAIGGLPAEDFSSHTNSGETELLPFQTIARPESMIGLESRT